MDTIAGLCVDDPFLLRAGRRTRFGTKTQSPAIVSIDSRAAFDVVVVVRREALEVHHRLHALARFDLPRGFRLLFRAGVRVGRKLGGKCDLAARLSDRAGDFCFDGVASRIEPLGFQFEVELVAFPARAIHRVAGDDALHEFSG